MEFSEESVTLPIENFHFDVGNGERVSRHGESLPISIRAVFCGPSNCGKTNTLLALLIHPNGLRFANLYVYSKSLSQPKFEFLKQVLEPIKGMRYFTYSEHDEVVSPDQVLTNSIMIFDDIACEKQDNVRAFFCMGRHNNVDSFYLNQSYASIRKHLIRGNVKLLVLFKQDEMNLKYNYDDHVSTDMPFAQFKELCSSCWSDGEKNGYGFLVIDKDRCLQNGRYRKIFDKFAKFAINLNQ